MKDGLLSRRVVRTANAGIARIVIVKFPRGDRPVLTHPAADLNHARRPEIGPSEFLLKRPNQLYRLPGSLRQTRRFHGCFARMFAAVTGTGVWHNDVNAFFGNAEGLRQIAANAKGPLRTGPDH